MIRAIVLLSLTLAVSSTCLFSQVIYVANTVSNDVLCVQPSMLAAEL